MFSREKCTTPDLHSWVLDKETDILSKQPGPVDSKFMAFTNFHGEVWGYQTIYFTFGR